MFLRCYDDDSTASLASQAQHEVVDGLIPVSPAQTGEPVAAPSTRGVPNRFRVDMEDPPQTSLAKPRSFWGGGTDNESLAQGRNEDGKYEYRSKEDLGGPRRHAEEEEARNPDACEI